MVTVGIVAIIVMTRGVFVAKIVRAAILGIILISGIIATIVVIIEIPIVITVLVVTEARVTRYIRSPAQLNQIKSEAGKQSRRRMLLSFDGFRFWR